MTISTQRDLRVTIISSIWVGAKAMFSTSILLNGQGQDREVIFLPATIVFGATTSTIVSIFLCKYCNP